MGNFCGSCFKGDSSESALVTPNEEIRRRHQLEAAERRLQEQENRGIKNPESVKRKQQLALERENAENAGGNSPPNLRWAQD